MVSDFDSLYFLLVCFELLLWIYNCRFKLKLFLCIILKNCIYKTNYLHGFSRREAQRDAIFEQIQSKDKMVKGEEEEKHTTIDINVSNRTWRNEYC